MATTIDPAEVFEIHKGYADQFAQLAQSGLLGAFSALSQSGIFRFVPSQIAITFPDFGTPNRVGELPATPPDPSLPVLGALNEFQEIPNPNLGTAPSPSFGTIPTYRTPTRPATGVPILTASPPNVNTTLDLPDVPPYLSLPSLLLPYQSLDIPAAPTLTVDAFAGVRPDAPVVGDATTLATRFGTERDAHRNALPEYVRGNADTLLARYVPEFDTVRTRLNTLLASYLHPTSGGGVGIPEQIEGAIHARASDRNAQEFKRAVDTAADTIARQGFTMPMGVLMSTLRQARMAMGDAQTRSSTEIATKNLELEQANFQLVMKLSEQFQEKVLDTITEYLKLALQMDAQAIAYAKEIVTTYISAYNLQVMVYSAALNGYQADAAVYRAKIDALNARVALYEAEIRAELAKTEVNKAHVGVLQAVADVNRGLAEGYKAQVEAATSVLEAGRIQVAIYEARVRAYAAQVGAYEAQWNGYRAEIDGEIGKIRGYEAAANAYTAQANGYRASVEAYAAQVGGIAKANEAITSRNEATLRAYAIQADVAIKSFEGRVAAYTAESNAIVKQAEIEVEYWRTQANLIFGEFNAALNQTFEYAREQMNLFRGQMEAAISAANGLSQAANVAGNLAGGAMQGLTSFAGTLVSSQQ